ncbi:LVIVD repeat-containing protein [Streptacidiphilus rugosus]|uniref:hypothetical protein n=1 Tax=Streptacidiphilus rugosus TaxID=405783 RepID=UPI00055C0BD2|nr:hypothetical protein [Streptacidiphilus rugosus]
MIGPQLALSDDNRLLATTGPSNDALTLWDTTDPGHPRQVADMATLTGVTSVSINHSATMMAVTNGTAIELWNITSPAHPVRLATLTPPGDAVDTIASMGFTTDGRKLLIQREYSVSFVDTDPRAVAAQLCTVTGNTVTAAQWGTYAPESAFRKPCP